MKIKYNYAYVDEKAVIKLSEVYVVDDVKLSEYPEEQRTEVAFQLSRVMLFQMFEDLDILSLPFIVAEPIVLREDIMPGVICRPNRGLIYGT